MWNWIRKGHHSGIGFLGLELTVGLYQNVSQSISFPGRKMTEDLDHNLESKKPPFWFPSTFMRSDIAPVSWRPCFSFMAFSVCLALKMLEKKLCQGQVGIQICPTLLFITTYHNQLGKF